MIVTIKLFASFQTGRFIERDFELDEAMTVRAVAHLLLIRENEMGVILVNSRHSLLTTELFNNDTLALFPMMGGG